MEKKQKYINTFRTNDKKITADVRFAQEVLKYKLKFETIEEVNNWVLNSFIDKSLIIDLSNRPARLIGKNSYWIGYSCDKSLVHKINNTYYKGASALLLTQYYTTILREYLINEINI